MSPSRRPLLGLALASALGCTESTRPGDAATLEIVMQGGTTVQPVDVADSVAFTARMLDGGGRPMTGAATGRVTWSCAGDATLWVRCDSVLVPRMQALARPDTVYVTARSGRMTARVPVPIVEKDVGRMMVGWPPASVSISDTNYFAQTAHAVLGDTVKLHVRVVSATPVRDEVGNQWYPYMPNRPFRFVLDDPSLVRITLGDTVDGARLVNVVGLREGTTRMRVIVNGAQAGFKVRVTARTTSACASVVELDMPLGEPRQLRGADATQCLRFAHARDAGRVWLVVTDAMPLETSRFPNAPGMGFDFEGQALFRRAGIPEPRANPVMRIYAPGTPLLALTAPLADAPAATDDGTAAPAWRVDDRMLREHAPIVTRGTAPTAPRDGTLSAVAVGDTLQLGGLHYLDGDLRTRDGAPIDTRAVVTHVGERLVLAELVDLLRGRLVYSAGHQAQPVPSTVPTHVDSRYAVAARQLDQLFPGTPVPRAAWGRDFGTRELYVNVPLAPGYWGYATGEYVATDYWAQTPISPREFADKLLAHEFAHMRQMSRYWPEGSAHPWQIEGIARFAERLAMTARATGQDTPSRTARLQSILDPNLLPVPWINYTNSLFQGYEQSAYVFDYLADQVAVRGGDGLAAARTLAASGTVAQADAAVGAALPGLGVHDLVLRARVAATLEQLRFPQCTTCLSPVATLPDWTRYLQYEVQALPFGFWWEAPLWPVLRPGNSAAMVAPQRTGTFWPTLIDGRAATTDATWVLDFTEAPQATVSVVRIR